MMNIIKKCWRGEEKLWKVFWLYGVLLKIVVRLALAGVAAISPVIAGILGIAVLLLAIPYIVWSLVSTWRCAFNVRQEFWGYMARIYVCVVPVLVIFGMLIGGILVGQDLIVAAKCRKEIAPLAAEQGIDFEAYKQQYPDKLPQICRPKHPVQTQTLESGE